MTEDDRKSKSKLYEESMLYVSESKTNLETMIKTIDSIQDPLQNQYKNVDSFSRNHSIRISFFGSLTILGIIMSIAFFIFSNESSDLSTIWVLTIVSLLFSVIVVISLFHFNDDFSTFQQSNSTNVKTLEKILKELGSFLQGLHGRTKEFKSDLSQYIEQEKEAHQLELKTVRQKEKSFFKQQINVIGQQYNEQIGIVEQQHHLQAENIRIREYISYLTKTFAYSFELFGIDLDSRALEETFAYFVSYVTHKNSKPEIVDIMAQYLSQVIDIPVNIILLIINSLNKQKSSLYWQKIKKSDEERNQFLNLLVNSELVTLNKLKEYQKEISYLFLPMDEFSLIEANAIIQYIVDDSTIIESFHKYLISKGLALSFSFENCIRSLITSYNKNHQDNEFRTLSITELSNIFIQSFDLTLDSEIEHETLYLVMYIIFLHENLYSQNLSTLVKQLSKNDIITMLIWILIDWIEDNDDFKEFWENIKLSNIIEYAKQDEEFYLAFVNHLEEGNYITNKDFLFESLVKNRRLKANKLIISKNLDKSNLPFDFETALNRVFATKVNDRTFYKLLAFQKKIKPYLITFHTKRDTGGIQEYLDNTLSRTYLEKYTRSARIGILTDEYPTLERIEGEITKGIQTFLLKDDIYPFFERISNVIGKFNNLVIRDQAHQISNLLEDLKLNLQFCQTQHQINYQKQRFIDQLMTFLEFELNRDLKEVFEDLQKMNAPVIPEYQVLIHRFLDSSKTITFFGPSKGKDPLNQVKSLYASYSNPDLLLATMQYDENLSIEKTLELVIRDLTLFELAAVEVKEIQDKNEYVKLLDKSLTIRVMKSFNDHLNDTLEFSQYITQKTKLDSYKGQLLDDQFPEFYVENEKSIATVTEELNKLILSNVKHFSEKPVLCEKISLSVIKSLLYINLVLYI